MYKYHNHNTTYFNKITLLVKNLDVQTDFYQNILGFTLIFKTDSKSILSSNGKDELIELITHKDVIKHEETLGLYHVAFLFPNELALSHVLKRLVNARYRLSGASNHGVSHALYLNDPEGNGIELYFDLDDKDWPRSHGELEMYTRALDVDHLYQLSINEPIKPIDTNTIIGHLHFYVKDLESAKHFYHDILGFDIIQNYYNQALFVSSKGYHHHLGLNIWNQKASFKQPSQAGLQSYQISISLREYELLKNRLSNNAIPLNESSIPPHIKDILGQTIYFDIKA
ncbi:MAG: VOC family protein [Acholeplasmataceae bacterium]